jgi:hypothetical protein
MGKYGKFDPSYEGLGELLRGPEMQAEMKRRAYRAVIAAAADAPVGPPSDPHRGEYRDSFHVEAGVMTDVKGERRAYGKVSNSSPHAVAVEYGKGGRSKGPTSSAHHTLGRALDSMRD